MVPSSFKRRDTKELYNKIMITRSINALTGSDTVTTGVTATIANTAAVVIDLSMSQAKSIQFVASAIASGNGAFGIEVSNDGVNFVVYNRLTGNATNTNAQTDVRTAAPTLSSNTSSMYFFPTGDVFRYIRVFVAVTTDGTYKAVLQVQDNG